jgi:phosphoserine phosphatase
MTKYIVFDLDETLLKVNSQYFFAESFFNEKSPFFSMIYNIISVGFLGKIISYIKKEDARRVISTFLFGFYSNDELYDHAKKIFNQWVQMTNPHIYALYEMVKSNKGYEVIIATATLDFIARVFAEQTGKETISSTYSKGKIINDLRGRKIQKLSQLFQGEFSLVVSDDFADLTEPFSQKLFVRENKIYIETDLESISSLI